MHTCVQKQQECNGMEHIEEASRLVFLTSCIFIQHANLKHIHQMHLCTLTSNKKKGVNKTIPVHKPPKAQRRNLPKIGLPVSLCEYINDILICSTLLNLSYISPVKTLEWCIPAISQHINR